MEEVVVPFLRPRRLRRRIERLARAGGVGVVVDIVGPQRRDRIGRRAGSGELSPADGEVAQRRLHAFRRCLVHQVRLDGLEIGFERFHPVAGRHLHLPDAHPVDRARADQIAGNADAGTDQQCRADQCQRQLLRDLEVRKPTHALLPLACGRRGASARSAPATMTSGNAESRRCIGAGVTSTFPPRPVHDCA